jgi:hypothetical protein
MLYYAGLGQSLYALEIGGGRYGQVQDWCNRKKTGQYLYVLSCLDVVVVKRYFDPMKLTVCYVLRTLTYHKDIVNGLNRRFKVIIGDADDDI